MCTFLCRSEVITSMAVMVTDYWEGRASSLCHLPQRFSSRRGRGRKPRENWLTQIHLANGCEHSEESGEPLIYSFTLTSWSCAAVPHQWVAACLWPGCMATSTLSINARSRRATNASVHRRWSCLSCGHGSDMEQSDVCCDVVVHCLHSNDVWRQCCSPEAIRIALIAFGDFDNPLLCRSFIISLYNICKVV